MFALLRKKSIVGFSIASATALLLQTAVIGRADEIPSRAIPGPAPLNADRGDPYLGFKPDTSPLRREKGSVRETYPTNYHLERQVSLQPNFNSVSNPNELVRSRVSFR